MKKITSILIIFILIVLFTKFYDINNILDKIGIPINTGKKIDENNQKEIIKDDFIKYNTGNIIYTDANGRIYTGIGTISIKYNNQEITILDRNLGATNNDINSKDSFGHYFQRGNNYGFTLNTGEINTGKKQININGYGPSQYSNSNFIIGEYGERITMDSDYESKKNLWGGGLDSEENERGLTSNSNIKLRQGPCPEGYHIPSIGERNILFESWIEIYTGQGYKIECLFNDAKGFKMISFNEYCNESSFINSFITTFKIPLAGRLSGWNLYHNNLTNFGYFWTSTYRRSFEMGKRYINCARHPTFTDAMPIRCFGNNNTYNI